MDSFDLFDTLIARRCIEEFGTAANPQIEREYREAIPILENVLRVKPEDVVLSNMYLPHDVLRELLEKTTGLTNELLVGAQIKTSGEAWETLKQRGLLPATHLDDLLGCLEAAKRAGVRPVKAGQAALSEVEIALRPDFPALVGTMREARLTTFNAKHRDLELIQTQLNFPLLFVLSIILHRWLEKRHICRALMSSRDCYLWSALQPKICKMLGGKYDVIYFLTSRIARLYGSKRYLRYASKMLSKPSVLIDLVGTGRSAQVLKKRLHKSTVVALLGLRYTGREKLCASLIDTTTNNAYPEYANSAPYPMFLDMETNGSPVYQGPEPVDWEHWEEVRVMRDAFHAALEVILNYDFSQDWKVSDETLLRAAQMLCTRLERAPALEYFHPFFALEEKLQLQPPKLPKQDNSDVLIAVLSCHKHRMLQDAQRKTWIQDLPQDVSYRFFLGNPDTKDAAQDEVFLNVPDDYKGLSFKTRGLCQWALQHGFKYVYKIDTDTLVQPGQLLNSNFRDYDFTGGLNDYFLSGGSGYVLSEKALRVIAAVEWPEANEEDVFVSQLLRANGIPLHHDSRYKFCPGATLTQSTIGYHLSSVNGWGAPYNVAQMYSAYEWLRQDNRPLDTIQSLWVGPVNTLVQLSAASYMHHGHPYHLYTYGPLDKPMPNGVVLKNGDDVVPKADLNKFRTLAQFSDWFRLNLLMKKGGWWIDADSVCLKPLDFPTDLVYLCEEKLREANANCLASALRPEDLDAINTGFHRRKFCGNGHMRAPKDSPVIKWMLDECKKLYPVWQTMPWATIGPALAWRAADKFDITVRDYHDFCPIQGCDVYDLIKPNLALPKNSYAVHFYLSAWLGVHDKQVGKDLNTSYPPTCIYEQLKRLYHIPAIKYPVDLLRVTDVSPIPVNELFKLKPPLALSEMPDWIIGSLVKNESAPLQNRIYLAQYLAGKKSTQASDPEIVRLATMRLEAGR